MCHVQPCRLNCSSCWVLPFHEAKYCLCKVAPLLLGIFSRGMEWKAGQMLHHCQPCSIKSENKFCTYNVHAFCMHLPIGVIYSFDNKQGCILYGCWKLTSICWFFLCFLTSWTQGRPALLSLCVPVLILKRYYQYSWTTHTILRAVSEQ